MVGGLTYTVAMAACACGAVMGTREKVCSECRGTVDSRRALLAAARRVCGVCGASDVTTRGTRGKQLRWASTHGTEAGMRALLARFPLMCDTCFVVQRRAKRAEAELERRAVAERLEIERRAELLAAG